MNKIKGNILNYMGGLCYRLNGGLDGLHNKSILDKLSFVFWAKAYGYFDKELVKEFFSEDKAK